MILGLYLDSLVPPEIVEHRARVVAFNSIFSLVYGTVSFTFHLIFRCHDSKGSQQEVEMTHWSHNHDSLLFLVLHGILHAMAGCSLNVLPCESTTLHCIIARIFLFQ